MKKLTLHWPKLYQLLLNSSRADVNRSGLETKTDTFFSIRLLLFFFYLLFYERKVYDRDANFNFVLLIKSTYKNVWFHWILMSWKLNLNHIVIFYTHTHTYTRTHTQTHTEMISLPMYYCFQVKWMAAMVFQLIK